MDFMQDVLVDGRRFRTLNILDLATRECLAIEVDTSLPGQRVLRVLDHLIAWYGVPKQITLDNGPEFAGRALDAWAYAHQVILDFIEPGKPTQNGHLESFNGKFRDECLICTGLPVCIMPVRSSPTGGRITTRRDHTAPYISSHQPSMLKHCLLEESLIIPGHTAGSGSISLRRVWTLDPLQDGLVGGRRVWVLKGIDLATQVCPPIECNTALPG